MKRSIEKFFAGRELLLATQHHKEQALRPLLEPALGVKMTTPNGFDTDEYGTFSGEIARELSPLDTARRKCDDAARHTGADLVLASEGSFGAHPVMGFVPADEEWLVLKDYRHHWEFKAKLISTQTNFACNEYYDFEELSFFAATAGFPSHALILSNGRGDATEWHKGINNMLQLKDSFRYFKNRYKKVYVQTDMRALFNPTRMKVIRQAGEELLALLQQECPVCEAPGFSIIETIRGLPCNECEMPTQAAKAHLYLCQHCGHSEKKDYPANQYRENPAHCDSCNP